MAISASDITQFYETPMGQYAQSLLVQRLNPIWPSIAHNICIGYGYTAPFLSALYPNQKIPQFSPFHDIETGICAQADLLPLADDMVNQLLVVHGLEFVQTVEAALHEFWRILVPQGRIIFIVPNRAGFWARYDKTPFGAGSPFSWRQLQNSLLRAGFEPLHWHAALMMPPRIYGLKLWGVGERAGRFLYPELAGVMIVEAQKKHPAPIHIRKLQKAHKLRFGVPRPVFLPR